MKAIILAGGFGTRLRPLTINLPKPMAPVVNQPMMEHVVRLCEKHGFNDLLCMLHYSPDVITRHFESGKNWDVHMSYLRPEVDLGTAGCIRFAAETEEHKNLSREPFMIISGDVLTDFDLTKAWEYHKQTKAAATIVLTRTKNPLQYGVVITDGEGKIVRFLEKPTWGEVFSDTINTGIYILNPEVVKLIPEDEEFDFSKNLFPKMMKQGLPIFGYVAEGYWKDVGDLTEYRNAHMDVLEEKVKVKVLGAPLKDNPTVMVGENCEIEPGVRFQGHVILGKGVHIGRDAEISQSVIGNYVRIGSGASLRKSVVWDRTLILPETDLREAIVGRGVRIGQRARIEVGAVVASRCEIGADAILKPSVKMWPEKTLEEGAVLSSSLVWGERWTKQLFGDAGITGLANIEVTPEFAAKLGAAYGALLGPGAYVITSRDAHKASRLLKRALISGLLSQGVRVGDLRMVPVPIVRYEMGKEGESGGVHVRLSPFDARMVDIRIFDRDGNDLPISKEKAIEQLFMREDFKRSSVQDVGEISVPPRVQEYYRTGFLKNINASTLRHRRFKVVIDYSHSAASQILPDLLGELGIESVAINAHTSNAHVTRTEAEFQRSLHELSEIVTTLKADAGFLIDNGAEKLFIVNEKGHIISSEEALVLVGMLVLQTRTQDVIAYPVRGTSLLEQLAITKGATVLRTPINPRHLLDYARRPNMGYVGDAEGGFIFPKFHPAFDAMYAVAHILEMLAELNTSLATFWSQYAQPIYLSHRRVPCSWGKKGQVMRLAQTVQEGQRIELLDGVKIHFQDGWVLVLPDGNEAYCHLWVEGKTEDVAKKYLENFSKKVQDWQKVGDENSLKEAKAKPS
ncbi:MAG: Glucose-1-phosphate adenylyltransferase [Elusimicrobia bacterium]|nr:Glucose-1-phosphate adenylyltransferase [Elusimicrobiota bacterium]